MKPTDRADAFASLAFGAFQSAALDFLRSSEWQWRHYNILWDEIERDRAYGEKFYLAEGIGRTASLSSAMAVENVLKANFLHMKEQEIGRVKLFEELGKVSSLTADLFGLNQGHELRTLYYEKLEVDKVLGPTGLTALSSGIDPIEFILGRLEFFLTSGKYGVPLKPNQVASDKEKYGLRMVREYSCTENNGRQEHRMKVLCPHLTAQELPVYGELLDRLFRFTLRCQNFSLHRRWSRGSANGTESGKR